MNCFCHGFNMNFMFGGNMFGGLCRPAAFPVMDPFWAGAINGYRTSMSNFFMNMMFNPFMSASLFSMPQMNYSVYPSYNNSYNNTFNYVPAAPVTRSSLKYGSAASIQPSDDWEKVYKELMESFEKKETKTSSVTTTRTTTRTTGTTTVSSRTTVSVDTAQLKRNFSPEFINKTKQVAQNLNCDWKDLMALMQAESGINPQAWNGDFAVGLIQFTDYSIADLHRVYGLNLTKEKIAQMSGVEQLDLVEKYLKLAKSYKFPENARLSAGDLYAINFLPNRADREVLATREEKYYHSNPIDEDGDGVISKKDLEIRLDKKRLEVFA